MYDKLVTYFSNIIFHCRKWNLMKQLTLDHLEKASNNNRGKEQYKSIEIVNIEDEEVFVFV